MQCNESEDLLQAFFLGFKSFSRMVRRTTTVKVLIVTGRLDWVVSVLLKAADVHFSARG